jgi:hypothetical protein
MVRTSLTVEDLGGLLEEPFLAVLATLRRDGSVLLSPIWYERRGGGFNLWVETSNSKDVIVRIEPGVLRAWDFADEVDA